MNASGNFSIEAGEHKIGTVILFLSFTVLASCICKLIFAQILKNKVPAPFTVVVLILGLLIGIIIAHINGMNNDFIFGEAELTKMNPHLIFYIFLPLLIFDSAFNSHFHVIKPQIISGILLAGPGVFICMTTVALCAVYIFPYNWSWIDALMFGSILSATDPVAVVTLLHDSGASKSLAALIDLESLLNDGSAFVIFSIFKDIVIKKATTAKSIIIEIVEFTIGGPAFGFACGVVAVFILNLVNNELEIEIISTFGLAYLIFYVADVELNISPVLALVVMGLYMAKHKYCISSHVQLPIANTWRIVIYFVNILIFIITGIILAHSLIGTQKNIEAIDFGYSIIIYLVLHVARFLSIVCLHPFIHKSGVHLSWKEYIVLIWSGLRGSMALILALFVDSEPSIDEKTRHRVLFHICMITLLTLIINGTSSKYVVRLLGLDHGTPESEVILIQALENMRRQTAEQLNKMKHEKQFADVDWIMLNEYVPDKLVQKMDQNRRTTIYRRLSNVVEHNTRHLSISSSAKVTTIDFELPDLSTIVESDSDSHLSVSNEHMSRSHDFVLQLFRFQTTYNQKAKRMHNELIVRFLTALATDYEKQWFVGMIRRPTLYILVESVEKAKDQCSLRLHWELIIKQCQLPVYLKYLMRFDNISWIKKRVDKLLFDHIFLTIELILAFHSARTRMENIGVQFPELFNIDSEMWHEVYGETNFYHQIAAYILLDLQESYQVCWRIQMTKRCAQMLLRYELTAVKELHQTGMLGEIEHSHIRTLIEEKLFDLEFFRVRMPRGQPKAIENIFDSIFIFHSIPDQEKLTWKMIMQSKHEWYQPGSILLKKGQPVSSCYLIVRGIVQCEVDTHYILYRSGNIVGIDALYSENLTAYGTYSVVGGILEVYRIDKVLLNQLLENDNLAPAIYCEIASHMLSNQYQKDFKLNRVQTILLLQSRARFYRRKDDLLIQLKENERLLLIAGSVKFYSEGHNIVYDSVIFKEIDRITEILLSRSAVVYTWTNEDEIDLITNTNVNVSTSAHNFNSILKDLIYPRYAVLITEPFKL